MDWKPEIEEIAKRRSVAQQQGGKESIERHHRAGKLTARERIEKLSDPGSFREYGSLAGHASYDDQGNLINFTPANVVIGSSRIEGRRVVLSADDFTVRGGSSEATRSEKWIWAETLALEMRQPLVRMVDTAGGSVKLLESMESTKLPGYPSWKFTELLGHVPVIAVAMGSVAGLGAFRVVASHFSIMVKETSHVFAAGPPLVEPATGEKVSKEDLGGYRIHTRGSGVVDNEADNEEDAFLQVRRFLSYFPSSVFELPPVLSCEDPPDRKEEELLSIIPRDRRKTYDSRRLAALVFDRGSLFEMGRWQGPSVIAMFGRLSGHSVGIMVSDPRFFGGGMDRSSAEKTIRFVDLCDTFHLPIVHLFDQPGVVIGSAAEKAGTIRYATRAIQTIAQSRVPWVSVILRRAFGVAGSAYGRQQDLNLRYAWPCATWGSLPIEGGIYAAHRRELAEAEDPQTILRELEARYGKLQSPFRTAERFGITDIIDPRETRAALCDWVEQAYKRLPEQMGITQRMMRV